MSSFSGIITSPSLRSGFTPTISQLEPLLDGDENETSSDVGVGRNFSIVLHGPDSNSPLTILKASVADTAKPKEQEPKQVQSKEGPSIYPISSPALSPVSSSDKDKRGAGPAEYMKVKTGDGRVVKVDLPFWVTEERDAFAASKSYSSIRQALQYEGSSTVSPLKTEGLSKAEKDARIGLAEAREGFLEFLAETSEAEFDRISMTDKSLEPMRKLKDLLLIKTCQKCRIATFERVRDVYRKIYIDLRQQ